METTPIAGGLAWLHSVTVAQGSDTVDLEIVLFDSHSYDLKVIDQPEDWSGGGRIKDCMRAAGAVAGVNGGFFTPQFAPMGLMISAGKETGTRQENKLLTGAVVSCHGSPELLWNAEARDIRNATDLIQAGPRLVDAGKGIAGLERSKEVPRTFIANDGGHRWIFGVARNTSLGELADILSSPGFLPGFTVQRALNLDGGRSSALYVRTAEGREIVEPGWSTVRNYLGIVPH